MDQDSPVTEEGEITFLPEEPSAEEAPAPSRRRFSLRPRLGKKGLLLAGTSGLSLVAAALMFFTALPLSFLARHLAEQGLRTEGIEGSFFDDWTAASLEFGTEPEARIRLEGVRFRVDPWALLSSRELIVSDFFASEARIHLSAPGAPGSPGFGSGGGSFQLLVTLPIRIRNATVAAGVFHHPQGKAKIESLSIENLSLEPETGAVHWSSLALTSDLGSAQTENGDLAKDGLNVQGLKARVEPGLFPELLRTPADLQGHLRVANGSSAGRSQAQLSVHSGKLSLHGDLGKLILKAKDLDLPKNFVFDFPLTLEEGDVEIPFFAWNDRDAWKRNLIEQLPKMKLRFGGVPLRYDDDCGCVRDEEFKLGLVFQESANRKDLSLKMIVNEYRPEPSFSSDEELLAETGWGKTLAFLPEADRNRIRSILPLVEIQRPPELPETKDSLLHDIRYLSRAPGDPETLKVLELIKKSVREDAPLPVLYFASLLASGNRDCERAPEWLAQISAKSQDPMLLGKSFAVLSQCEDDPKKQKQLVEMAKMYLPKDPYIQALLHRIQVEHFPSVKTDGQASRYLKDEKTEKELSLLVIEGFLKREARSKSLAGTLRWAKEKHRVSGEERDLDLVRRLESVRTADKRAAGTSSSRRPASAAKP